MTSAREFHPDWVSAPGDTIADILGERQLSLKEFAKRIGRSQKYAHDLVEGRATITLAVARRLGHVFGGSVEFWISRDFQYREDAARFAAADKQWLDDLPIGDMIKFGWLRPTPHPSEELRACLRFFGVPSVSAWRQKYTELQRTVAFRTSPSLDSHPPSVVAWLRRGEIEGESIKCCRWDPAGFRDSLANIRRLTQQKDPRTFIPSLQQLCAASGVAVAIVRAPNGCRASGATRFISTDKALLLLSFRFLSDDQFWFSFFHEAGHLLLHSKRSLFLEGEGTPATQQEREANFFAENTLVPPKLRDDLMGLPLNGREVVRFARRIGISAGIVVGQLQHHGKFSYRQLNGLKRRFKWGE